MKRQLPKNVRQIGNVSDSTKIYVEDYVDTFFNQLCDKADQMPVGAFLIGEMVQEEEEHYIYVYGAVKMQDINLKGKDIHIDESTWKHACETCKNYFGNAEILGWFLTIPGQAMGVNHNLMKVHQRFFAREQSIFVMKDTIEREEQFYVYKYRELMECAGHYIYYEKNEEMQNYMIASRKKLGVTPSEIVEDRITKDFRNVVKEKMIKEKRRRPMRFAHAAAVVLLLLVVGAGITMLNNYERMIGAKENMEDAIDVVMQLGDEEEKEPELLDVEDDKEEIPQDPDEPEGVDAPGKTDETDEGEVAGNVDEPEEDTEDVPSSGQADTPEVYIVEKGDTLATISKKMYGDMEHVSVICEMNGLEDGNLIFIGQKLLLP